MNFSSESLPLTLRQAGYEAALQQYFSALGMQLQLDMRIDHPEAFAARVERLVIGQIQGAIHGSNSPHRAHAAHTSAAQPGLDFYLLRSGQIRFTDTNGDIELGAGDMVLLRSDDELLASSERFEMIALGIPDNVARDREMASRWQLSRRIPGDSGMAACLNALLGAAAERNRDLTAADGAVLQMAILDAIVLLATCEDATQTTGLSQQQREKLSHLKTLALRSLQIPDLTPCAVAAEGGVSPRTLHRLFNASGSTFRTWLRDCRLERCWAELTDPGRRRGTIAAVAFRWGFNDLRTFNRAFSARYGMTPLTARDGNRGDTRTP